MSPAADSDAALRRIGLRSRAHKRQPYYHDEGEHTESLVRHGRPSQRPDRRPAGPWVLESARRPEDPFTRGRVLQSGGGANNSGHDYGPVYELQNCAPGKPAQTRPDVRSQTSTTTAVEAEHSEPGLTIAGVDLQTLGRGIVVAAYVFGRIAEEYQRQTDREENGEGGEEGDEDEDEFLGLDIDPFYLEAGRPRRYRPLPPRRNFSARKATTPRALIPGTATTAGTSEHASTQGSNSITAQAKPSLAPLPVSKRVCYHLIAAVVFGVVASFGVALWWARSQGDVSAGFTIGSYAIAVDALVVAVFGLVHRPRCRCWEPREGAGMK
ncbi:hypothetical protein F5B17DRAFT_171404 [Nemania serpens]|nr:hypothetical protein F5B17DRAFT_171404 [Nemania serpens]